MYNGAIADNDIACNHRFEHSARPFCGKCEDARYRVDLNPSIYWCIDFDSVESAWYRVSFYHLTYLDYVTIATHSEMETAEYLHFYRSLSEDPNEEEDYLYIESNGSPRVSTRYGYGKCSFLV